MPPYATDQQPSNIQPIDEPTVSGHKRIASTHNQSPDDPVCYSNEINKKSAFYYARDIHTRIRKAFSFKTSLIWLNLISISLFHIIAVVLPFKLWQDGMTKTVIFGYMVGFFGGFGVTAGAHRLWCHRSYKATLPLRIILIIAFSIAGQNPLYDWVRDHRVHHKFSETDADPHNSKRGFFFSHVGWLMMRKHPDVIEKGNLIDMSDINDDPVVQFHQKYFKLMKFTLCFFLPVVTPMVCWNETFMNGFVSQILVRYVLSLNFTWLVNSLAHILGEKPYNKTISPVENKLVAIVALGEGWHNYHHAFPWDYKAAELGSYSMNYTTFALDMFAKIGWAYDLRQPSNELVMKTVLKSGDGTHPEFGHMEISQEEDVEFIKEY